MPIFVRSMDGGRPEVFVDHLGVKVYRACPGDDVETPMGSMFTTYPGEEASSFSCFDPIIFPESRGEDLSDPDVQKKIIKEAISRSHLDRVGPRGFRMNVEFILDVEEYDPQLLEDMQMDAEDIADNVEILSSKWIEYLLKERPFGGYRITISHGCQSLSVTFSP